VQEHHIDAFLETQGETKRGGTDKQKARVNSWIAERNDLIKKIGAEPGQANSRMTKALEAI
jgi:hypothetical protein